MTTDWMIRRAGVGPDFAHSARLSIPGFACPALRAQREPANRATVNFQRRSCHLSSARIGHRFLAISSSPDFFGQEIPARKGDLTTVIVRRRIAAFFT
ncbi:hypothetical protein [Burkholderia metallica]|uniref:hypothetical protein n=1 Tax=Burkholderia metallica TaxID=488729 RepID=UPI001CF59935|nr:hypothetical protein [Burkholderia metallica]MCA8021304.1 hypothetical protein [Burkholderia metallica]